MKYIEHAEMKERYEVAKARLADLLQEKEELFDRTQPRSVPFDKERVDGGGGGHPFDDYLTAMERTRLDERIAAAREILHDRSELLRTAEEDVRKSAESWDVIYCLRILDGRKISEVAAIPHYSEAQVYRVLREIDENVGARWEDDRKREEMRGKCEVAPC